MDQQKFRRLLSAYFDNSINPSDLEDLLSYLKDSPEGQNDEIIDKLLSETVAGRQNSTSLLAEDQAKDVLAKIKSDHRFHSQPSAEAVRHLLIYQKTWFKVAASLLIILATGIFTVSRQKNQQQKVTDSNSSTSVARIIPGGNKATLTLAGGQVITLDGLKNGLVSKNASASITKTSDGKIVFDGHAANQHQIADNLLSTPKGGAYQLALSDGTIVHLNSSSSLSFPAQFIGKERIVKLTGEGYFEVAKNKEKPFYVEVNDVRVKVLGTHFNVNAYDKSVVTTLLEGSVKVAKNGKEKFIVPGQQAVITNNSNEINISEAKTGQAVAWTRGYFQFDDDDIATVMKQVSRWYDVDIEYRGDFAQHRIGGTFARSKSITELLAYLEQVGRVHFKVDERRIVVMK